MARLRRARQEKLPVIFAAQRTPVASRYQTNIVAFVREILGADPRPFQEKALRLLLKHKRLCIRAPHGSGKTALAAWIVLWGLASFPAIKVPTTATAWRQLTEILWPEIRWWALQANWGRAGIVFREDYVSRTRLELGPNRFAVGIASKEENRIEGFHAPVLIYVFDEAKGIPPQIWDAAEGAMVGGELAFAVAISTPGTSAGRFYDIQTRKPGTLDWESMHVTAEDCIHAVPGFEAWMTQKRALWGENSSVYKRRVLAEFAEDEEGALIPLWMVEAANERWYQLSKIPNDERTLLGIGVDVGGTGSSQTVLARLYDDNYISVLEKFHAEDTMAVSGYVERALYESQDAETQQIRATAFVDVIGIGAGVADRLKERGLPVLKINVSVPTKARDITNTVGFINLRSLLAWRLRERLDPSLTSEDKLLALPPDDELTGDLTSLHYEMTSSGYKVESKEQVKKRLGRSPDCGDAVMLALWEKPRGVRIKAYTENPFYD